MDTRKATAGYRLRKWAGIVQERNDSGLSVKAYCESVGIHENTYYYRQKKLREAACAELAQVTGMACVTPQGGSNISASKAQKPVVWAGIDTKELSAQSSQNAGAIKIGRDGWTVTVESGFDGGQLTEVLRAVSRACC